MDLQKAKSLDQTLQMFRGNLSHTLEGIQKEQLKVYGNLEKYYPIENDIKYLLGDDMLREVQGGIISLSNRGFGALADVNSLGYKAKIEKGKRDNIIKYVVFVLSILTFLILLYKTFVLTK
ncbi:hypothetical protein SAMN04487898_105201 [Pedobacter sp. ok626]|uniref:hypothetical protein n=1 Tax=Pedobacter sp. ok626 TaxID=1761882 RepID=UPI00088BFA47|nr:hypothetical protein [Pedobacter sp. ok626]SDJ97943.1 hypothetical protein SAMN04487898_105201 [Pedobacter sp. ok626]